MKCPACQHAKYWIIDTRDSSRLPNSVRRRVECDACKHRWTTYELDVDYIRSVLSGVTQHYTEAIEIIDAMREHFTEKKRIAITTAAAAPSIADLK